MNSMKHRKRKMLRAFVEEFGMFELFSTLEDVAYEKDVEEHKANPMESDYYWPGVIGIAKNAREKLMTLKTKEGRI